jgi:hypothetical protein
LPPEAAPRMASRARAALALGASVTLAAALIYCI